MGKLTRNEIGEEGKFCGWFVNNAPRKFTEIREQVPLFNAYASLERKAGLLDYQSTGRPIGKIDFVFYHNSKEVVAEVKYYPFDKGEFWYASKALCYCTFYNWQMERNAVPAVMIPKKSITLEQIIIGRKLGLRLYGITKTENDYTVERIEDYEQIKPKHLWKT